MTDYKNPQKGQWKPHSEFTENASLWIRLDVYELTKQAAWGRGNIVTERTGDTFTFLAPKEFIESTVHDWADYESMMGRLAQKAAELEKGGKEIGQIVSSGSDVAKLLASNIFTAGADVGAKVAQNAALKGADTNMSVINQRYDAPLYYKGSDRRKFDLIFYLVEEGDACSDVVVPVRMLQALSSPVKDGVLYGILPPHIFSINSEPDADFLFVEYAALKAVQPTWRGPYIGGYPSSCELTLSFEDMTPLFHDSFGSSFVTVRAVNIPAVPEIAKGATAKLGPRIQKKVTAAVKAATGPYNKVEEAIVAAVDPRL